MRRRKFFYIIIAICFVCVPMFSFAQVDETLEGNLEYRNLKIQLDSLSKEQSSINEEIDKCRELIDSDDAKKDEYVSMVLNLEGRLFDVRSKIGILSSKCSAIEQEFIIKNLDKKRANLDTAAISNKLGANVLLLTNKYFTENVASDEMRTISKKGDIDSLALALRDSMRAKLLIIKSIDEQLRVEQDGSVADSLYKIAQYAFDAIDSYENRLATSWGDVFDTKIYVYNRLLDKLNVSRAVMSRMSEKQREVRSAKDYAEDGKFSPAFYTYHQERELILGYEKILAEKLVYMSALDSINRKIDVAKTITFEDGIVELPQWNYVYFQDVKVGGSNIHTLKNKINSVKIPTYGKVYMLKLMTLSNPVKSLTSLKNVNPVMLFVNESGKYEYYTGLYRTQKEAEAEVANLKRLGFSPVVVQWRDGGKVTDDGVVIPIDVSKNSYKVEFDRVTPELTAKLKELAPTKELMKMGDNYSIGFFKNYLDAVKIKKAVGVDCRIVAVSLNV